MSHTVASNRGLADIPVRVQRAAIRRLSENHSLASLPETARWTNITANVSRLQEGGEPIVLNIYGEVNKAALWGIGGKGTPALSMKLWYEEDIERAQQLFVWAEEGTVKARVLYTSNENASFTVSDETGLRTGEEGAELHAACIREGDLVRVDCHLLLVADVTGEPTYELHMKRVCLLYGKEHAV